MRYHVTYLTSGRRETTHVDAPDAAAAVETTRRRVRGEIELLLVVPDKGANRLVRRPLPGSD